LKLAQIFILDKFDESIRRIMPLYLLLQTWLIVNDLGRFFWTLFTGEIRRPQLPCIYR